MARRMFFQFTRKPFSHEPPTIQLIPPSAFARVNFNVRGDCSICLLTDVPCHHRGRSNELACAGCTMTGRA